MSIDVTGIGALSDLASTVVKTIWPDKSAEEQAQLAGAIALVQGQIATNQAEAVNPSVFVSGWRPFIGWVCGSACAWNWIGLPVVKGLLLLNGVTVTLAPANLTEMMPVLMGMLGLGTLRTVEKINGVAAK
jgi:hypothetical protein